MCQRIFRYELPTAIEFGFGAINTLSDHVRSLEGSRVLLVADPGVVQAGVAEKVLNILTKNHLSVELFSDIQSDPDLESIDAGVQVALAQGCDLVVGVGGGSSLDTAKAIGLMMKNEGNIRDYIGVNKVPRKGAPVIAVPTTAGTGSEITIWSVLSDRAKKMKVSVGSYFNCPDLALCDPDLTLTLPPEITAATGMDALTHAIESYVNKATQPISQAMSVQAMRFIAQSLRQAVWQGDNREARYSMLLASLMAAMAFNPTRLGLAHALAMPLGARFHIPHGLVNAILLPEVMQFNVVANVDRFCDIAEIFGCSGGGITRRQLAEKAVSVVRQLKEDVGITKTLSDFGVQEEALHSVAVEALESGNVPVNPRRTTVEDLMSICRMAM
ncbi:MAG: iron-containing alcohol dehydrogenase [Alicyclobacillus herbarius]|uniref:iron-containing alcohol dehydrogenase n=1 Tax=Alicyclobacillus herbarius TaxID=122960 RepID=UPI002351F7C3|nr:iron-containing alcohol dehydrogenase [Alicyclobacillus herbarius]MCL6632567.1 iron-containing alcohol dehydrogenase [Alicyclobacillus herbarius]